MQAGPLEDAPLHTLLDEHFDGRPGLAREFPLLLAGSDPAQRTRAWAWCDAKRYVAHAAWRPIELITRGERVHAAGVGLVTTHRDARGRGLASALIRACVDQAAAAGAEIALLFSPPRDLYRRLGFVSAGRERIQRIQVDPRAGAPRAASVEHVRAGTPADAPALSVLLARQPLRIERSEQEFADLLAIPDMRIHVVEREGRSVAYCIEGKGRDLRGVVHEWAGEGPALEYALRAAAVAAGGSVYVAAPASAPPLRPELGADQGWLGSLAQARILRPERFGSADAVRVLGDGATLGTHEIYVWGLDSF